QPVLIHFLDNTLSPALLNALASHPFPVPWYGFTRITSHLTDLDFCRALKQSGCAMLKLGLESGDQKVLDSLNKGVNLTEASQALKILKRAGVATYVYLIFGTVPENSSVAKKTYDFVVNHCDYIDFLNLAIFNLPVYGAEVEKIKTKNFYDGDLSLYTDFLHPQGWNRKQVREFLDKEFTRHPAIASIIRREPPFFTSNHAPFFVIKSQGHLDSTFPFPYKG
ncbi:MAG TPA: radical SAM protein, partial [Thermodesulfobacteriota bacterium]|nr:radical SAM protein [Thermodesulfobacteriota bacterium]